MLVKPKAPELGFHPHGADLRVREHKYGVLEQAGISANGYCPAPSVKRCAVQFKTACGWGVKFSAAFMPAAIGAASLP